ISGSLIVAGSTYGIWGISGPSLNHDLGICFFGSTKGMVTTVAFAAPSGVSTSSSVPTAAWATGTMAYPIFRFNRGEKTADGTIPTLDPLLKTANTVP